MKLMMWGAIVVLVLIMAPSPFAHSACLTLHECLETHSGYCRHHAGCWHTGSSTRFAERTKVKKTDCIDPNPYGDPMWTEIDVDRYCDPIWNLEKKTDHGR
jgi:hypothetical protein